MNSVPDDRPGSSVVIVGTGVAGITAAETLRANGFDGSITVFGEEPHLPYRRTALSKGILDGDLSDAKITLRPPGYWDERGIRIVPSVRVTGARITAADAGAVTLSDGTRVTGTVIGAIGMQPDTALADAAGLRVSPAGIVVDEALRTSAPGIYAAGDVAARPHPLTGEPMRAEQWLTATEHGKLVAMTIAADLGLATGPSTPIPRVPLAWSMQYSSNIQMVGWPAMANRFDMDVDASTGSGTCADGFAATVRCFDDDRLVGAVCMGRGGAGRALRTEIEDTLEPVGAAG